MQFAVLGPLDVLDAAGEAVDVGGAKPRALLSLLLLNANRVVSVDRIVDELWGADAALSTAQTLQTYVSALRRALEPDRGPRRPPQLLLTRAPGYLIDTRDVRVDVAAFVELVAEGERLLGVGEAAAAELAYDQALGMWRGEPYAELTDESARAERARLRELRLLAYEKRAEAMVSAGRSAQAVADLERLTHEHPLREQLAAIHMTALYHSGRQADALEAYRVCREHLNDELGIDPSPALRELEQAILRQDLHVREQLTVRQAARTGPHAASASVPASTSASASTTVATSTAEHGALVGRRGEQARLRDAMAAVAAGHGRGIVLEGEAGIGKTRLAESAAADAAQRGWRTAWSRCADTAGAPAMWPWRHVFDVLGSPVNAAPNDSDPDAQRFALFQSMLNMLRTLSAQQPVAIVIDDAQAADESSLDFLRVLAQNLDSLRVLLVVTVRTVGEPLAPAVVECLAALARERAVARLPLSGLSDPDVHELVVHLVGDADADRLAPALRSRTDGNPFFITELVQLLRSERRLGHAVADIPPSIRDVLDLRVNRLPDATRQLLRVAAVIGRNVPLDVLADAAAQEPAVVIEALEPAVLAGLLTEDNTTWGWRFSHALVQEILVAGLAGLARARLHGRVALALERRSADTSLVPVDRLAHHFAQAAPVLGPAKARHYAVEAARAAREQYAWDAAAAHTTRALELLQPDAPDHMERRHALLVDLAHDYLHAGRTDRARDATRGALDVARALNDPERMAEAAVVWGGPTLWNWRNQGEVDWDMVGLLESLLALTSEADVHRRAALLGTLAVEYAWADPEQRPLDRAREAVALARTTGDPALIGRTLNNLSLAAWGTRDQLKLRLEAATEALSWAGRGLPRRVEFLTRLHRGPLRLTLGDAAGFEADLAAARELSRDLAGPEVRPHVLYQQSGLASLRGEWSRAEELAREGFDLYAPFNTLNAQICYRMQHFTIARAEGTLAEVVDEYVSNEGGIALQRAMAVAAVAECGDLADARRLYARWHDTRAGDWSADAFVALWGEVAARLTVDDVDRHYAELLPLAGRHVVVGTGTAYWGSYDAVLGRLARARGDETAAAQHLAAAVERERALGADWYANRSAALLL